MTLLSLDAVLGLTATPPDPSVLVSFGIGGIAVVMALLTIVALIRCVPGRAALSVGMVVAWSALWAGLAAAGVFAVLDGFPPRPALIFVGTIGGAILFAVTLGRFFVRGLPLWVLVASQSFRLPLELVMHAAAEEGTMPHVMTYGPGGYNYDIITGITAIIVAVLLARGGPRWLAWVWNVLGLGLLIAIAVVAFLSSPMVMAFGDDKVNTWVAFFPFIWLPTILVFHAIVTHIVVFRKLMQPDQASGSADTGPTAPAV